ncbi:acyl-CoA dehydrogenase family protein [Sphingomonas immobilis]|uniref:Acyl-CoA dehydrogenase family protein n=1 Tax=Sphingomonas immobilis TaxID=3063997 RepID=A0ABT9A1C1_9SPHN|nr:acyl-CoA dehydrogenase family protein [Sphingomonas sp. CA1-15]MDO7843629.1 acyl-CoA dehydrogenase family protein [Sphingomonas sp. CA1-15]
MEFGWPEAQRKYRERVRSIIDRDLPEDWPEIHRHGLASPEQAKAGRVFAGKLAKEGLLVQHWPKEFGGGDGEPWEHFILGEEMWPRGEPRGPQYMNVNWLGPALMKYASAEQRERFLPPIIAGDVIWCQLFSEPSAGSDLAAMQTKSVRVGEEYVVNGMKVWTSYARLAEWGFLLTRSGPARRDITILLVDMKSPGITIRPFPGIVEDGHLHEVYFDNVRVHVENRLFEENRGWEPVTYALNYERVGVQRYQIIHDAMHQAVKELKRRGTFDNDPLVQRDAGIVLAKCEASRLISYEVVDQRARNLPPSEDASVARMSAKECIMAFNDFVSTWMPEVLSEEPIGGDWQLSWAHSFTIASAIAAGAYEIQCDIVATRQLGLPRGA